MAQPALIEDFIREGNPLKTFTRKVYATLLKGRPEKWVVRKYIRGRTLNVGAGRDRIPGTKSVDNLQHQLYTDWKVKPDYVCDAEQLHRWFKVESVDCILAMHLFEHLERPEEFLTAAWIVLKTGGHLCLVLPDFEALGSVGYYRDPTHIHEMVRGRVWAEFRRDTRWKVVAFNRLSFWFPFSFDIILEKI